MKEKLLHIQQELKCNKGQYNSFGKYKYRSCEDILESVKPLLDKYKCVLTLSDELEYIGERYYIKAVATLQSVDSDEVIFNTAYAREEEDKKDMDGSQITGTSSSYARKYALNGLFAIDDTKDADTDEFTKQTTQVSTTITTQKDTTDYKVLLEEFIKKNKLNKMAVCKTYKLNAKSKNDAFRTVYIDLVNKSKGAEDAK